MGLGRASKRFLRINLCPQVEGLVAFASINQDGGAGSGKRAPSSRNFPFQSGYVRRHDLGTLATQTGAGEEARTHLERTIALDPEYEAAWRMLARLYRTGGQAQALQALQARYRSQFSTDLP
jgi:Tfp pilus assembly protein PilF